MKKSVMVVALVAMICVYPSADVPGKTHQPKRSSEWPSVRKHHLMMEPQCAWCKCRCSHHLQIHHIEPFHEHPELELNDSNLITLCECPAGCQNCKEYLCHLKHGHLGDFKKENPNVRGECDGRWKGKK